jgi:hypothetical protein
MSDFSDLKPEVVDGLPNGARGRHNGKITVLLDLARANPGQWIRWETGKSNRSGGLNREAKGGFLSHEKWEFHQYHVDGGNYIYAKFDGPKGESA